ncbi:ATP phosphoribosyltransferase [Cucurbitaria berberidis CBS 394.84]|uniref:ATP phosphoribosyltransferase n=1 Tax=Cucurbitaria berberidis CBS 394.84 TaxID=1168544 RepID=A0A9P4L8A5_9PLEO|nr:ATP phosphoribosyltransferase [Cucurbitaria berberidis CBS 394.84]KAF1845825.1 ATP phosphoribosyltransferase [Cucurbitaria berberidis CBS 394.84]
MGYTNGVNGANGAEEIVTRQRQGSRSLPFLTDLLGNSLNDRLLFAVPKKGRLHQVCLDLLQGSDIQFHRHSRLDIALVKNLPLALVFLPAADIPTFVGEGRVDLGITGRDQVAEHECVVPPSATTGVEEVLDLEFGKCALQVQVPAKGDLATPEDLIGKNVVTSFTNLAEQYFRRLEAEQAGTPAGEVNGDTKLKTVIKYVGGSVEAACALGVADGIVDLVESGETMRAAGLKAISTVVSSSAILIKSKRPSDPKLVELITARIKGVITAQKYVLCTYNIERSKLEGARKITPGRRAPTVNALEEDGWVAVQAMVLRKDIAIAMDKLTVIGASDLIVTKIENSRTD